jgi:branched-chain amino acid transport system permease protein
VLGGIGTLWGGPIGAGLVVVLEDRLASSGFNGVGIITGAIFIVIVLAFRHGIWGTARNGVAAWMRRRRSRGT